MIKKLKNCFFKQQFFTFNFNKKCKNWHFLKKQFFSFLIISQVIFDLQKRTIPQIEALNILFWPCFMHFTTRMDIWWAMKQTKCLVFSSSDFRYTPFFSACTSPDSGIKSLEPNRNMRMAKIYSERLEFPTKNILIAMLALEGPYFLHSWLIQADGRAYFISAGYLTVFCLQSWTYVEKKSLQGRRKVNDAR